MAFPCISTGAYRFPFEKAAMIALKAITDFLETENNIDQIFLVVFDKKELRQYQKMYTNFFGENYKPKI